MNTTHLVVGGQVDSELHQLARQVAGTQGPRRISAHIQTFDSSS
jgi:hypothetical protein